MSLDMEVLSLRRPSGAPGMAFETESAMMRAMTPTPISKDRLSAELVLRHSGAGRVGADRVELLRAIRETGAISAAAQRVGLSYKGAWDAVQVLNNLFERPLVMTSVGGREGGATTVTPAGEAVLAAYDAAGAELARRVAQLQAGLASEDAGAVAPLLWKLGMRTSARNALRGVVTEVTEGAVNSEVRLAVGEAAEIVAVVTRASVTDLELAPGVEVVALIKASFVILSRAEGGLRTSARNQLGGTVVAREDGAVSSEVTLELAEGKTLTAVVTRGSAEDLDFRIGDEVVALVKASHVILAVG